MLARSPLASLRLVLPLLFVEVESYVRAMAAGPHKIEQFGSATKAWIT